MFETNTKCRICKSEHLSQFFDLGETALANSFLKKEELNKPEPKYPLRVFFCEDCGLSQLGDVVDPSVLFRNYVYFSSGMPKLSDHFRNYAEEVVNNFITSKNDLVIEIGSNDGILIGAIKEMGTRILGVDPAENIAKVANERGIETIADFFSEKLANEIVEKYGQAKVMIGNNVVAHINDYQDLIKGVKTLLSDDGVFIFEAPYLIDMFENLAFDTIYHEHLSYLSVRPLKNFFEQFGLQIFDVKILPVQGNSLRVYVSRLGKYIVKLSVEEYLKKEKELKMDTFEAYKELARRASELKERVLTTLRGIKNDGKKIAAYGAPAKGNTLLNYFRIGPEILDYATETLPSKIGLYTPGTHIPVIDIEDARKNPPDYYLLLAWNYKDIILEKEKDFRERGGKFIVPVGKEIEII